MMRGMVIDMNDKQLLTLGQLPAFLNGTAAVDFAVAADDVAAGQKMLSTIDVHIDRVNSITFFTYDRI